LQDADAVDQFGNLARQTEYTLIEAASHQNLLFKEAITRKLAIMRADLAGPAPSPVERLLVERIVAGWLQLQDADIRYAQSKGLTIAQAYYHQRRIDNAHKRYLSAIKTLAVIRKLAVPVLQVNIARKQVNVAGSVPVENDGSKKP
jgi:hypothetical protein